MTIARNDLPLDAVSINGNYIEDNVTGYMTLKAVGREIVLKEAITAERPSDGSILMSTRYPARTITVDFIIKRDSMANMRASMDKLKTMLDANDAKFIFNGDSDYYYIGTPIFNDQINEGWNAIVGSFVINCFDPFKYSNTLYESTAAGGQFNVTYKGTYKSYPIITAEFPATYNASGDNTNTSECGYVGYTNQSGAILQFGDPEATDWGDVTHPATTPLNKEFKSTSGWTTNGSQVLDGTQVGSVAISDNHVYPSAWGTNSSGYHGPSLSLILTGETPPLGENFNFTCVHKFNPASAKYGGFECLLWNNNAGTRTLVGGFVLRKIGRAHV